MICSHSVGIKGSSSYGLNGRQRYLSEVQELFTDPHIYIDDSVAVSPASCSLFTVDGRRSARLLKRGALRRRLQWQMKGALDSRWSAWLLMRGALGTRRLLSRTVQRTGRFSVRRFLSQTRWRVQWWSMNGMSVD